LFPGRPVFHVKDARPLEQDKLLSHN
jgi:hypothetical protein